MSTGAPQKTTPTVQLCLSSNTNGGRHGCYLGNGLGGPLSTAVAGVHGADVHYLSSHRHRMGALPLAADGDESDLHHRFVAAGSCVPALDGLREVFLSSGLVVAARVPAVVDSGDGAADRSMCDRLPPPPRPGPPAPLSSVRESTPRAWHY